MHYLSNPCRQTGSTLIISLIILVIMMLLGIAAVTTSNTQYKLAGNLQFEDSAMNNAETAVNTAETALANGAIAILDPGFTTPYVSANGPVTAGLYPANSGIDPLALNWPGVGGNGNSYSVQALGSQNYIIELMSINSRLTGSGQTVGGRASSGCSQVNTYRITGRGTSARGAVKFVQSFYSVLSC
ncbi:MAG: pilus assembly protein [Nitrosomonadales bacterium]|nr:pilus assembly protein [Nitrosomonadales bacterium]